jgi:hypothetical protein
VAWPSTFRNANGEAPREPRPESASTQSGISAWIQVIQSLFGVAAIGRLQLPFP